MAKTDALTDAPTEEVAPFLASIADTAPVIEHLREELAAIEGQKRALDEKTNDLNTRIAAFVALRQAHGLPPVL